MRAEGTSLCPFLWLLNSGAEVSDNLSVKRRHALTLISAGLLVLSAPAHGQQPGAPSVTFQTEVNYVDVDAIVTDEQGNFVGNLTKDDFQVLEDGKPQKIDMFSTVEIPVTRQDRFLFLDKPLPTDVRSNREAFAGRLYVIVLDDLDISAMRTAQTKKVAREFIEKHFGANDVAAVVNTSGRTDAVQEFTGDPQLLLAAIDKFVGRRLRSATLDNIDAYYQKLVTGGSIDEQDQSSSVAPRATDRFDPTDFERSHRAIGVLDTVKNLAEFLSTVRGRRKALIILSEGIDYPMNDIFGSHSATDVLRATQDAVTAAARANVNFFTLDPRGLIGMTTEFIEMQGTGLPELLGTGPGGGPTGGRLTPFNGPKDLLAEMRLAQDSLRTLAEETGGFAALNSNSFTSALDRIVQSNSRYYVIGYYPPTHPRDGRFHKIDVRVKQPGLKVAARKGYASPRGKTPDEKRRDDDARRVRESKTGGANNTSAPLRDALNSPMQQGGLTFSVQAAPFRNTGKEASVALAIELDGGSLQFAPQNNGLFADHVELSFFSVNEQGKPQHGTRTDLNLTLRADTYQRVKTQGLRANPRIALAPGRYQLRIGARENGAGRLGSVFYDLQVPDFTNDPLMMSGVLLSAPSSEQTLTAQADPTFAKLLPGAATSRREFLQSDTLTLLAEIYDNISSQQPRQIDTSARLIGESGREVFAARDSLANSGDTKKWDTYAYTRQIPLKDIAPGRYLLQVGAQVRGNANGAKPVVRETLITVR
jgi:VWFA-related protein